MKRGLFLFGAAVVFACASTPAVGPRSDGGVDGGSDAGGGYDAGTGPSEDAGSVPLVPPGKGCPGEVKFASPVVEAAVRKAIQLPQGPISGDAVLAILELRDLREVDDLAGMECLLNLENLWIWKGGLTSLAPLKALTRLQHVGFQNNQVQDLSPLNDKPLLKEISAESNAISTLDNLIVGAAPAPPDMPCYGLYVDGNPLPNAEAQTERFCKLHWTVTWDNGPGFHGCNAECLKP